ncbi:Rpp14/Pop5 family-domain-containing protein [Boeremia exigua]|uniref:Rpp14/Pop5 family-domain-containing protein n=1 Tax=Boeremia exigua TaxID=749465 RepID=UPI001E8D3978|nr:Rpp14/Pop5 family-domain-containing protein [Boeremia exigua]KAH6614171.1 Rpp14/Pop5 family-domain-containing protein [Boeremia exigua]
MVRVKFRYLVVNFLYPEPSSKSRTALPDLVQIHSPTPDAFNTGALVRLLRDAVEELYGDYGSGMVSSSLKVNYYSPSTSTAIIRCPRDNYEMVWAALTYVTKLPRIDTPVVCRVLRVSGTIRKAEEEVIRRSQQIVKRAKAWESRGADPMLISVEKSVEKERKRESVLAVVDQGDTSDEMSE